MNDMSICGTINLDTYMYNIVHRYVLHISELKYVYTELYKLLGLDDRGSEEFIRIVLTSGIPEIALRTIYDLLDMYEIGDLSSTVNDKVLSIITYITTVVFTYLELFETDDVDVVMTTEDLIMIYPDTLVTIEEVSGETIIFAKLERRRRKR
jgi:hypothetical protein